MRIGPVLMGGILDTWNAIGSDVSPMCECNADALEMIVDADRLSQFGSEEANMEFLELVKKHGYNTVMEEMDKLVVVW